MGVNLFNLLLVLVFCWGVWITIKSYRDGNPNWYALATAVASFAVGILANVK